MDGDRERWNARWRERAGELESASPFLVASTVLGWDDARLTNRFNMTVIRSAAATKHGELLESADERLVLTAKLHRVAVVELRTLIQVGMTHA